MRSVLETGYLYVTKQKATAMKEVVQSERQRQAGGIGSRAKSKRRAAAAETQG